MCYVFQELLNDGIIFSKQYMLAFFYPAGVLIMSKNIFMLKWEQIGEWISSFNP